MNMVAKKDQQPAPTAQSETAAILSMIARAASDPAVDINKLERLWEMQERALARQAEQVYAGAMTDAQAAMPPIQKNRTNTQTNSRYADLQAVNAAVTPVYTSHGFALSFGTEPSDLADHVRVVCEVMHRDGHSKKYGYDSPIDDVGIAGNTNKTLTHGRGSAISYGRRYLVVLIFNLTLEGEDNDGNGASKRPSEAQEAAANDFLQAIVDADTVAVLRDNVGTAIAKSGLPGGLMKKVRAAYTARLAELRRGEA